MVHSDEEFEEAAAAVRGGRKSDSVRRIADAGAAKLIVDRIISDQTSKGIFIEQAFENALKFLERYAEFGHRIACVLMLNLYESASEVIGMHDVCNAIDLWVDALEPTDAMKLLAPPNSNNLDDATKAHFEAIIKAKQNRT